MAGHTALVTRRSKPPGSRVNENSDCKGNWAWLILMQLLIHTLRTRLVVVDRPMNM